MEMTDILSLTRAELSEKMAELGEKPYRASQIYEWLHIKRVGSFDEMTNIPAALKEKLREGFLLSPLAIRRKLVSRRDNTIKYLFGLADGQSVETVLMEYKHGNSICLSTQVGCKMGCEFCASTKAGFVRNLAPSEILRQIYDAERDSGRRVDSIVLMGIGEPLDNFDNVIRFLTILNDGGKGMSMRNVSLSTCGLVERIYELSEMKLGVTLSVSLHAATDEKRSAIMPVNKRYGLEELMKACRDYFDRTGRRISFEYSLINGVNDTEENARELAALLGGMNCHINLIPVNEIKEREFTRSRRVEDFRKRLAALGLNATVRRTLGADINAACGQLRRDEAETNG